MLFSLKAVKREPKKVQAKDLGRLEIVRGVSNGAYYMRIGDLKVGKISMLRVQVSGTDYSNDVGDIWNCPPETDFIMSKSTEIIATFDD